jgi:CRP-like cAMP-binding protein
MRPEADVPHAQERRHAEEGLFVNGQTHMPPVPLFEGLPPGQQQELALIASTRTFRKGQVIFSEGDEGKGFYVVIAGKVKVYKLGGDGKEQILRIFGPGEPVGEAAVFAGERFPAHAEAMEESRTLFFPRASFVELIKKNPSLAMNMLALLSKRLRTFAQLVEDLSLKEVPSRLAAYLLYLSRRSEQKADELCLDIAKGELASLLGTIPETLSRILAKMSKQGLIHIQGRHIRILDRAGLEQVAKGDRRLAS